MLMAQRSFALYGAQAIRPDSAKYLVNLHLKDMYRPEHDYFCQGILVSTNKVLTTAHCIEMMGDHVYSTPLKFVFNPELVVIKARGESVQASSVTLAPSYYNEPGLAGEDLALIEFVKPFKNSNAIALAPRNELHVGTVLTMVSQNKQASTLVKQIKNFGNVQVIKTDGTTSGVCEGDSGGALILTKNNQAYLAGILIATDHDCVVKNSTSYSPKLSF